MPSFPIMLTVRDRRCVIIGGGPVALRRSTALIDAGARVVVVAPRVDPVLAGMPVELHRRPYRPGDLRDALLVIAASDDPDVNQAVADEARRAGVLINRADGASPGDFTVPAHAHHGPITLAVHTGGASATAAAAIRRELSQALDGDWARLLDTAADFRPIIQERFTNPDERRRKLAQLAEPQAMAILKDRGRDALIGYYRELIATEP